MTTYYVSTTGNDITGDGSSALPWASISKALLTVPAAGGHTVKISAGTYSENTATLGYLYISSVYASYNVFESESGIAADVIIQGTNNATYNTLIVNNAAYIHFRYVTFTNYIDTSLYVIRLAAANNIKFTGVKFTIKSQVGTQNYACSCQPTTAATVSNIIFTDSVTSQTGAFSAYGFHNLRDNINKTLSNIQYINCSGDMVNYPLIMLGGTGYVIDGGDYSADSAITVMFGTDAVSTIPTTGLAKQITVENTAGHGLLIGGEATDVTVDDCDITGGDYGIVFKECDGPKVRNTRVTGGTLGGIYFKAAVNSEFTNGAIRSSLGYAIQVLWNTVTGNKSQNVKITYSNVIGKGTGSIFNWGDVSHDAGGGECNYNNYYPEGSGSYGDVYGTLSITTLAGLQAAWATYDKPTNDSESVLRTTGVFTLSIPE
jgi:hypothetical protein